jgi:hypothetical protein
VDIIAAQQTGTDYTTQCTIDARAYQTIEISIRGVPCIMQPIDKDGAPLDEILVEPGVLTIEGFGGVRFKNNPLTQSAAATISAYAWREGEPTIAGLAARDQLSNIWGPIMLDAGGNFTGTALHILNIGQKSSYHAPVGGGFINTQNRFTVPPGWLSMFISVLLQNDFKIHLQLNWYNFAGDLVGTTDLYRDQAFGGGNTPLQVNVPVLGDQVEFWCQLSQGFNTTGTIKATLTNIEPWTLWNSSPNATLNLAGVTEWTLIMINQVVVANGVTVDTPLPSYAGPADVNLTVYQAGGAPVTDRTVVATIRGEDQAAAPNILSRPYRYLVSPAVPADAFGQNNFQQVTLAPHINTFQIQNNDIRSIRYDVSIRGIRSPQT